MKNLLKLQILFTCVVLFCMNNTYSQSCGIDFYEEGKTVDVETLIYPGILESYPEYLKAKEKKKPQIEEAYLADLNTGKIKPTLYHNSPIVSKVVSDSSGQLVEFSTYLDDKTYTSQVLCTGDSMYITRNKFPITSENENGELIGVAIQGVKVLPMNIEVGDFLTPFQDIAMSAKTTEHFTVEEEFLSDIKTTTNIRHGHFTDSYDGQYKYGT